jgi:hypothetical protein
MTEFRSERREKKRQNARKMRVSGRSVFLLQELGGRPRRKRRPWIDRSLDKHEKMGLYPEQENR